MLEFMTSLGNRVLSDFRSASYNIYMGGRDDVGRTAVMKHIQRMSADVLTIAEAGSVAILQPLLEVEGYTSFYGVGGTYELFFASKYPITYSYKLTEWVGGRNPLYNEIVINNKTIGILSVHLDSQCSGLCHDADYTNIEPQEPAAYTRNLQLNFIVKYMNERKVTNPNLKGFIVQGDYNLIFNEKNVLEYTVEPNGGAALPAFLSFPLANRQMPEKVFESYSGVINTDYSNAPNGHKYTWWDAGESPNPASTFAHRLDYISYTDDLELIGGQILNSISDADTLSKLNLYGTRLNFDDGYIASDHLPVFSDFKIK